MKIGLLIYGTLNQTTGGYLYDRKLVEHLREEGEEVEILSLENSGYFENIRDNFDEGLYERLLNLNADVLLQDELNHPSLFHLNEKLRGEIEYPILSIVHHLSFLGASDKLRKTYRFFEKKYLKTIDGFIFTSKTTRSDVRSLIAGADGAIALPGKDHIEPKYEKKPEKGNGRALFVGNIIPRKGITTIIRALDNVEGLSLKVVGDRKADKEYTRTVRKEIEERGLDSRVDLTGSIPDEELDGVFRESDFLVVPSLYEGYGIVYVEALGYGLPVIAPNRGGASEIIEHGREGYLTDPGDVGKLSKYMERMKDRSSLKSMSERARERYEELPTWEESTSKATEYLRSKARNN